MDFFGHWITSNTFIIGPSIIAIGIVDYVIRKYFLTYSKNTVDELNEKSFLNLEGTFKTTQGSKIIIILGVIAFLLTFSFDFFGGQMTADREMFLQIQKQLNNH